MPPAPRLNLQTVVAYTPAVPFLFGPVNLPNQRLACTTCQKKEQYQRPEKWDGSLWQTKKYSGFKRWHSHPM
jgi:hypothetical protein